jgi:large subunit ribosomal protein L13
MTKKFFTEFPIKEAYRPKYFILDATNKRLGRLATLASKLLRGKNTSTYTPGVDRGNFVIIVNANKIQISGKKSFNKLYYRHSQRPGSLKIETFDQLKARIPSRILEKAIWGMLPKGVLGRNFYRRLFVYKNETLDLKKKSNISVSFKEQDYIFL